MLESVSFYDNTEGFYQGLMLGLCAILTSFYKVRSNRESGFGRFDICLFPLKENLHGYIFELKYCNDFEKLEEKAAEGLNQIDEKQYVTELLASNVKDIRKMAIAFNGKKSAVAGAII